MPGTLPAPSMVGQADPHNTRTPSTGWTVRVSPEVDLAAIPAPYLRIMVALERLCRDRSYCWASNETLARACGCQPSGGFRRTLADMERDGWIYRAPMNPARPTDGRLGIFLLRRLDLDRPVEDRPPSAEAIDRLRQARDRAPATASVEAVPPKRQPPLPQKRHPPLPQKRQENKDGTPKKDDDDKAGSSSSDLRSGGPEPPAAPDPGIADLTARAEQRFGGPAGPRVAALVAKYGRAWVEAAIGLPNLRAWGGVHGTLANWRAEGGPPAKGEAAQPASDQPIFTRAPEGWSWARQCATPAAREATPWRPRASRGGGQ